MQAESTFHLNGKGPLYFTCMHGKHVMQMFSTCISCPESNLPHICIMHMHQPAGVDSRTPIYDVGTEVVGSTAANNG